MTIIFLALTGWSFNWSVPFSL